MKGWMYVKVHFVKVHFPSLLYHTGSPCCWVQKMCKCVSVFWFRKSFQVSRPTYLWQHIDTHTPAQRPVYRPAQTHTNMHNTIMTVRGQGERKTRVDKEWFQRTPATRSNLFTFSLSSTERLSYLGERLLQAFLVHLRPSLPFPCFCANLTRHSIPNYIAQW